EDAGRPQLWNDGNLVAGGYASGGAWADNRGPFNFKGSSFDGKTSVGPCAINCTNDNEVYSFHVRGANGLIADGSFHFFTDTIDDPIMAALVTRAGGELLLNSDF